MPLEEDVPVEMLSLTVKSVPLTIQHSTSRSATQDLPRLSPTYTDREL